MERARQRSLLISAGLTDPQLAGDNGTDFDSIARHINDIGCSDGRWWSVVRRAMPEARRFLDVGSNKGYSAAMIFALWSPQVSS